jgi:hypothetical protein
MIPNVFISSTIADLKYLRDGLRDAIDELSYNPVMSEHGEVGYIQPTTAAEACSRTVQQCQLMVLIVGKRYGSVCEDGNSVTHREFLAARESGIPTVTFVEGQVLSYKEVFDTDPSAEIWRTFAPMDNPKKTFALLDDIRESETYNAILPFTSVGDAKTMLKRQIADFVGDRLSEAVQPVRRDLKEVLAEIKTLRNQLTSSSPEMEAGKDKAQSYLQALRFLLEDKHADYRSFLSEIFGDLDRAVPHLLKAKSFEGLIESAGIEVTVLPDSDPGLAGPERAEMEGLSRMIRARYGMDGSYVMFQDKTIKISTSLHEKFRGNHESLHARLEMQ